MSKANEMRTMTLLTAGAVLALSGCASTNWAQKHAEAGDYDHTPGHSKALNVAEATGLTECDPDGNCEPLDDVAREDLPASMQGKTNMAIGTNVMDALAVGQGIGQVAGAVGAVTALGSVADGMFSIGSVLLGPTTMRDPATVNSILAWMPRGMADSPEQANEIMAKIIRDALPTGRFDDHTVSMYDGEGTAFKVSVNGRKDCYGWGICRMTAGVSPGPYDADPSPDFVASQHAYAWTNWQRGATTDDRHNRAWIDFADGADKTKGDAEASLGFRRYVAEFSANLPDWVYIYIGPNNGTSDDKLEDEIAGGYPVIYNQGEALVFVEPKTAAR